MTENEETTNYNTRRPTIIQYDTVLLQYVVASLSMHGSSRMKKGYRIA